MAIYPNFVDPNRPNPNGSDDASFIIYGYVPSIVLGVIGTVFYGLCLLAVIAIFFKIRRWDTLNFLLGIGLACEVVGYIFRILSNRVDPYRITFFVVNYFMIVVAPVFFAASIYLALGRIIRVSGRRVSPLGPRAVLSIFLTFDVITIIMQVAGAGWIGAAENNGGDITVPENILKAGLAFQTFSFTCYGVVLAIVTWNVMRITRKSTSADKSRDFALFCRNILWVLGIVSIFVQLRTVFRLAESIQGFFETLSTHEIYFGLLESFPIMLAMLGLVPLAYYTRLALMRHGNIAATQPDAALELSRANGGAHAGPDNV